MTREVNWGEGIVKAPLPTTFENKTHRISVRYDVLLATTMFGGGVDAGSQDVATNDPVTPIRGTEIRGQLRFWWRATRGRRCLTSAETVCSRK